MKQNKLIVEEREMSCYVYINSHRKTCGILWRVLCALKDVEFGRDFYLNAGGQEKDIIFA